MGMEKLAEIAHLRDNFALALTDFREVGVPRVVTAEPNPPSRLRRILGAIILGTSHGKLQRRRLSEEQMMSPEPAAVRGISAVTLATHDMGRAVRFYEALGLPLQYGGEDASFTALPDQWRMASQSRSSL